MQISRLQHKKDDVNGYFGNGPENEALVLNTSFDNQVKLFCKHLAIFEMAGLYVWIATLYSFCSDPKCSTRCKRMRLKMHTNLTRDFQSNVFCPTILLTRLTTIEKLLDKFCWVESHAQLVD